MSTKNFCKKCKIYVLANKKSQVKNVEGAAVVVTNELGAEDRAIYNPDDGVIMLT